MVASTHCISFSAVRIPSRTVVVLGETGLIGGQVQEGASLSVPGAVFPAQPAAAPQGHPVGLAAAHRLAVRPGA